MPLTIPNTTFSKLSENENIPYELLLLADPSKKLIDEYLMDSEIFVSKTKGQIIGVIVLFPLENNIVEIKNIAVKQEFQGKGIGTFLIENIIKISKEKRHKSICIGTSNSSIAQLYLYQKLGFEIVSIKKDFFLKNYPNPIYENGIQAKHMLILSKNINE